MDSAFFSEEMIKTLEELGVEYAISVPFERYHFLKDMIAGRRRWKGIPGCDKRKDAFEKRWKPKCWRKKARFIFVRTVNPSQTKGPLQLDLFEPKEFGYDFKCVVTNKTTSIKNTTCFLEGRGSQEGVFEKIHMLRNAFIRKAGRLTNPSGKRTLTLNKNPLVERYLRTYLAAA